MMNNQPIRLAVDPDPGTPDSGRIHWITAAPGSALHTLFTDRFVESITIEHNTGYRIRYVRS